MSNEPAYVQRLLSQAREEGQWYCGQPDAAALCYEILALFPDHREAADLIYGLFCDEWLIYDNRNALQQHIDEWDDRPWQQRRRLALSFRSMSRWEGKYQDYDREGPPDVAELLDEGKSQLISAYCLGDDECANFAWPLFAEAIEKTADPQAAMLWAGLQYADLGFFADSVEVLAELCSRFDDEGARRLLAEVRWWRDNARRLPWLPPPGDGRRYRHMIMLIDPERYAQEEQGWQELRDRLRAIHPEWFKRQATLSPEMAELVASALPAEQPQPATSLVDWSFLDTDDGQPGELPEWAKKQIKLFGRNKQIAEQIAQDRQWSRPIKPPSTPPRHDPNEPPFDPSALMDDDDWVFDDFDDLDEEDDDETA